MGYHNVCTHRMYCSRVDDNLKMVLQKKKAKTCSQGTEALKLCKDGIKHSADLNGT